MSERDWVLEDFADKVGQIFTIADERVPPLALTLTEATLSRLRGGPVTRPPFVLVFSAEDPRVFPQTTYRMEHETLGELNLFIVPIGKTASGGIRYEAVFN